MADLSVTVVEQHSPLLGRQKVHDERSRAFPVRVTVDRSTWRDKSIRLFEPRVNPAQEVGCCTGVAKCSQFNAVGNRVKGKVLNLADAMKIYSLNTTLDPFEGTYPPDDTGSSGLASAKAAKQLGLGGEHRWFFGGSDEVVQAIQESMVVSAGTWWYRGMMRQDKDGRIHPTGESVGGHQYVLRGYDKRRDWVLGRCWWGPGFKDFWLARQDLDGLLRDGGDAHWQVRT